MKLTQETIGALVTELNSPDDGKARAAGESLDKLLYPRYPTVTTADESRRISEAHDSALQGSAALDPLLQTLVGGSDYAREYAATVLGAIKEPRAIQPLITTLRDDCAQVRYSATKGLWFFRDTATVDPLVESLGDTDPQVRHGAASALGFIGSCRAVPALTILYESGNRDDMVAALYALGDIGDPESLPLARKALNHNLKKVKEAAKSALAKFDIARRHQAEQGGADQPATAEESKAP